MTAYVYYIDLKIVSIYKRSWELLAQIETYQSALIIFSTPFCENRYRIIVVLAERCCYFCKGPPLFYDNRVIFEKISVLHKPFTTFAYNIRAPPSEVLSSNQISNTKEF